MVPLFDRQFLTDVVDISNGELSMAKWKKLYAVLAVLADTTHVNYRIYQGTGGLLYDATVHEVKYSNDETLHQDVVSGIRGEGGAEFTALRTLKFEIQQLDLKIERLNAKRNELMDKYDNARHKLIDLIEI
jgi:hypothetical protein